MAELPATSSADSVSEIALGMRRERAISLLMPLFFTSGATALVYQTLWARQLHLVFGTSTFAIATVLAAFMAGLALGGFWMGRHADRMARPLRAYGLLEIGIGVYAGFFPFLLGAVTPLYLEVWRATQPGPVLFGLLQFTIVGSTLLIPTAAMGATLPLLARFATQRLGAAGDRVGTLYAVNTAGAVFGTAFCGFYLLPAAGLVVSTALAAAANLALGLAAVGLDNWSRASEQSQVHVANDLSEQRMHPMLVPVGIAIGLGGFASLVYEVAWTRLMGLMLGASVYAFSVMLLAFLVGIAVGGKIGGVLADRVLSRGGQLWVLRTLALTEVGIAVLSYLLMYLYPNLPFWYVWLFDWVGAAQNPVLLWAMSLVLSGLVMTPPALLMGIAFPVAVRAVVGREDALGGPVGVVYGANTLGGVFGAFLAGFVLLPGVGLQGTIFVAAVANLLAAALLLLRSAEGKRLLLASPVALVALALLFVAQRPPWDPMLMTAGMYHYVSHFDDHSREGIQSYAIGKYELVYYEEGLSTVVTVAQNIDSGNLWLANNGKVDASTSTDMPTQLLCSLLPMQFAPSHDDVLVIGLASGITAGALTLVDDMKRMEVVELEPAIERAAKFFGEWNHDVLMDPRVELIVNDGRNHVLLAAPGTYDVIVSEPPNPWITGVANLFTKEFWEVGKTRLKPGGVWSQWVQLYGMDDSDLRSLLRTFASVYPHVLVYSTIDDADLVLIGSEQPIRPTLELAEKLLSYPRVREELALVDVNSEYDLVAMFQMDRDVVLAFAEGAQFNTDDNMRIEYNAPLHLHQDTQDENMQLMFQHAVVPFDQFSEDALELADLARTYWARNDHMRAVKAMGAAAMMLERGDPLRDEIVEEIEQWQAELIDETEELEASLEEG